MGRSNRDVGGYRGRRTVTDILKLIAIILGVLVVLAVAGVIYLQRYVVYTDEGTKLELPPFLQMLRGERGVQPPEGSVSLPSPGDLSIDIQPAGSQSEPQPSEQEKPGFAMQLPVDDVINGTAADKLAEAGADALILEVKGQDGKLVWLSEQPMARRSRVNGTQAVEDALIQWNAGEVYTVARVCCFRDDSAPYYNNSQALRRGNGNWKDELGLRWLSPAKDGAQAYIAGLCGELAAMGFDEIVLEDFHFPIQGNLDKITRGEAYDPAQFNAQVEDFLSQVIEAVNDNSSGAATVALRVTGAVLGEGSASSGVTPQTVYQFSSWVWSDQEGFTRLPDLQPSRRMVEVVPQAAEDRATRQAVIPPEG